MPDQLLDAPDLAGQRQLPTAARAAIAHRPGGAAAAEARPRAGTPAGRRRRVVAVLGTCAVVLAAAGTVVAPLRWAAAGVALLVTGYLALVARVHRRAVRRDMAVAFAAPGGGFDWLGLDVAESAGNAGKGSATRDEAGGPAPASSRPGAGLGSFVVAYLAGWALTPVAIAARLVAGDRRDLDGNGVLAQLVALQRRCRARSLRAIAVSVATTAGVGAAGSLAGMAAAAPAATAAPAPGSYTVVAGDTLAAIAAAHGTTVGALAAANHLADPDLIFVGQQLSIGAPAAAPGTPAGGYVVQPGDTLAAVAVAHGTTVAALVAANHLADPNLILVGQVLSLAGSAAAATPLPPTPATVSPGSYTVVAGDTLGAIAAAHGTTVAALVVANGLADPNLIYAGEVLSLAPAAAGSPATAPAPVAATPSAVAGSTVAAEALSVALAQVGKPYQWAGAGPATFDCSGLVMYAYEAEGVSLPHYTVSQYQDTIRVTESQLQPGDLVFYGGSAPSHVAMYAGGGQVVTADTTGTPVRVESITWDGTPSGYGRVG